MDFDKPVIMFIWNDEFVYEICVKLLTVVVDNIETFDQINGLTINSEKYEVKSGSVGYCKRVFDIQGPITRLTGKFTLHFSSGRSQDYNKFEFI